MDKIRKKKIKRWYELGSNIYRLNIVYSESKDELDFIRDMRRHLMKSRIDKNYFMFDDRKILIKDIEIRSEVVIENNKSIFTTPDKVLVMMGIISTAMISMFKGNDIISYLTLLYILVFTGGTTMVIIKEQQKNIHNTSFTKICFDIIKNIDNDLYYSIQEENIGDEVEPKSIIENEAIIKEVSEVE